MWYIGAPAATRSCSATLATVASESTAPAAWAAVKKIPLASRPIGPSRISTSSSTVIVVRRAGEAVAALDAALGAHDAGAAQAGEQLLEELHGDVAPPRQFGERHRTGLISSSVPVQLDQRTERVRGLGGDRDHDDLDRRAGRRRL